MPRCSLRRESFQNGKACVKMKKNLSIFGRISCVSSIDSREIRLFGKAVMHPVPFFPWPHGRAMFCTKTTRVAIMWTLLRPSDARMQCKPVFPLSFLNSEAGIHPPLRGRIAVLHLTAYGRENARMCVSYSCVSFRITHWVRISAFKKRLPPLFACFARATCPPGKLAAHNVDAGGKACWFRGPWS